MGIVNSINNVLNSKYTGMAMFATTGAYKVHSDYKQAPKEEKLAVLTRDLTILGGSALGIMAFHKGSTAFGKSKVYSSIKCALKTGYEKFKNTSLYNFVDKNKDKVTKLKTWEVFSTTSSILKDCSSNVLMVGSGILGAIGANYILEGAHIHKKQNEIIARKEYNEQLEIKKQSEIGNKKEHSRFDDFAKRIAHNQITDNINHYVGDETTKNIMSNITNMPELKIFTNSMIGLQSFDVMQEKTFKDKLKKTTKNLITGTFVPIFYLSLASNLTKQMKNNALRLPFVFTTMIAGTMLTNKYIEKQSQKLENITASLNNTRTPK